MHVVSSNEVGTLPALDMEIPWALAAWILSDECCVLIDSQHRRITGGKGPKGDVGNPSCVAIEVRKDANIGDHPQTGKRLPARVPEVRDRAAHRHPARPAPRCQVRRIASQTGVPWRVSVRNVGLPPER